MLSCEGSSHPDLQWLGINLEKNQVYSFDLFLDPQKRGDNAAAYLQSSFLEHLKEKGIRKVYGYFWSDNIPALWVHRQLKYRELNSVTVNRFFFIKHRCS
jgi:GNAT superfamily N-acetyltransferase